MVKEQKVRDLMIPVENYASVKENSTLLDAILALEEFQAKVPGHLQPIRSILVLDDKKRIIGKIGHLGILKALEPKYDLVDKDLNILANLEFNPAIIKNIMDTHKLWSESFPDMCKRCSKIKVRNVMNPVTESVEEGATLVEAIHKLIMYQVFALFVIKNDTVTGIIRLADVYREMIRTINNVYR